MASKKETEVLEVLDFNDSAAHIKINYREEYPLEAAPRTTFGHVPVRLHDKVKKLAAKHNMQIPMVIATMYDFYEQHETEFAEELKEKRKSSSRRG